MSVFYTKPKPTPRIILTEKICTWCRVLKPIDEFYDHFSCKDGKQSNCKSCTIAAGIRSKERYKKL